jgi:hypothetical protein
MVLISAAYKQDDDPRDETEENTKMPERTVGTLVVISPKFEFIVVPSGTKVGSPQSYKIERRVKD